MIKFKGRRNKGEVLPLSPFERISLREPTDAEIEMGRKQLDPMLCELGVRVTRTKEG